MDATKRALNDERYAKMLEFSESLPPQAREFRFAVFEGNPRTEMKRDFRPLEKILYSKFIEQGFKDEGTFAAYLDEKFGPGCYFVEPLDEHNKRLEKLAAWIVHAGDPMDDDDDYDDDRPRGRGRWRRQRYDDEGAGPDDRANTADLISTVARQQTAQVSQVAKSSNDFMSILMLQQSQATEARQAEERRRDEQRAEERRREEVRAEERRREQEQERRERDEREERRREEARVQYQREEERRREEARHLIEASNKRMEVIAGLCTTVVPVLGELFKKKEDTLTPILLKLTEKKDDPIVALLLKSILDKDSSGLLIQQMGEMQKISASMTVEQMTQMMKFSTTMNETIMKKAIDMMMASPEGKTPEGKNMIEQIMGALQGAAEIVKTLVPGQPPPQPAQGVRVHTAAPAAALPAPAAPPQPAPPEPIPGPGSAQRPVVNPRHPDGRAKTPAEIRWESMTPEEQAKEQASMPTGTIAVLMALKAIHTRQYGNQAEYQQLVQFLVTQMPLDLRVAVLNGDELGVAAITTPVAQKEKEIWEWLMLAEVPVPAGAPQGTEAQPSTLAWIRGFTSQLPPSIEAIHGPAQAQRDQLEAAKAAMAAGQPPPEAAKPAPAAEVPAHTPAPPPPEIPPAATAAPATEAAPAPAAPLAGPGHVPMEAGVIPTSDPPPPMAGGEGFEVDVQPREINPGPPSHLSDHDAP